MVWHFSIKQVLSFFLFLWLSLSLSSLLLNQVFFQLQGWPIIISVTWGKCFINLDHWSPKFSIFGIFKNFRVTIRMLNVFLWIVKLNNFWCFLVTRQGKGPLVTGTELFLDPSSCRPCHVFSSDIIFLCFFCPMWEILLRASYTQIPRAGLLSV